MTPAADPTASREAQLDRLKFELEARRYKTDLWKWVIAAVGAIVSFAVIDFGKLQLEQFRVRAENQRLLLSAYLTASESAQPDVWKRKLHILSNFAGEKEVREWAERELIFVDEFAAKDTLYRETLKVAAQLVEPSQMQEPDRIRARIRFNQLYWADLPFARESGEVAKAMIDFRDQLLKAESTPNDPGAWANVNGKLISLSGALRDSAPKYLPAKQS